MHRDFRLQGFVVGRNSGWPGGPAGCRTSSADSESLQCRFCQCRLCPCRTGFCQGACPPGRSRRVVQKHMHNIVALRVQALALRAREVVHKHIHDLIAGSSSCCGPKQRRAWRPPPIWHPGDSPRLVTILVASPTRSLTGRRDSDPTALAMTDQAVGSPSLIGCCCYARLRHGRRPATSVFR